MAISLSDKVDFRTRTISNNKHIHFIIIKKIIHPEDIKILNMYELHLITASKYMKQKLPEKKRKIDNQNYNTFISTDRARRKKK